MKINSFSSWAVNNKAKIRKTVLLGTALICCILLIGAVIWVVSGLGVTKVNWTMKGYLVTADGEMKESVTLTLDGKIKDNGDKADTLELDFSLPESFPYSFPGSDAFLSTGNLPVDLPYLICSGYGYDKTGNTPVYAGIALDTEKEFLIIQWDDDSGLYLVAATDANAQPQQILEFFQFFTDKFSFD